MLEMLVVLVMYMVLKLIMMLMILGMGFPSGVLKLTANRMKALQQ